MGDRQPPEQPSARRRGLRKHIRESVLIILVILFVKGCVVDQYSIPTDSMAPTLRGGSFFFGDRVVVNKFIYGPRIPFTHIRPFGFGAAPERWDMVVFTPPENAPEQHTMIKRVVGLPGERIFLWDGRPNVDGVPLDLPEDLRDVVYYYNDFDLRWEAEQAEDPEQRDYWMGLHDHLNLTYGMLRDEEYDLLYAGRFRPLNAEEAEIVHEGRMDELGEAALITVPDDCYFVLGDNSSRSQDGRVFGWLPRENILGPAEAIWWPWPRRRDFTGFTHTWWGMLLIYGLPAAWVLYEVIKAVRKRRRDMAAKHEV